jgi:GNAT superfamily N-acetyltransferase
VAFVVREDFQGLGVASYLLEMLEDIAKENGYREFSAAVLRENTAMLRVFQKRYPNAKMSISGTEVVLHMDLETGVGEEAPTAEQS